jgi:hypothetical protein
MKGHGDAPSLQLGHFGHVQENLREKTQKGHKDDGDDVKQTGMFKKDQN